MFNRFRQRIHKHERLDTGDFTPAEYNRWQREMWFIHRAFGEVRALRGSLLKEIRAHDPGRVSILDVGAGSGDLLQTISEWLPGKELLLVGAEFNADAVKSMGKSEIQPVRCDALNLPFDDDQFDYIFSSLFLHHLTDEQAVTLLIEMARVARKRFFVIDLHRHPIPYYFYRILSPLFLQQFTQEDGALSILKSFRPGELRRLADCADIEGISIDRSAMYRLVLSGGKRS